MLFFTPPVTPPVFIAELLFDEVEVVLDVVLLFPNIASLSLSLFPVVEVTIIYLAYYKFILFYYLLSFSLPQ